MHVCVAYCRDQRWDLVQGTVMARWVRERAPHLVGPQSLFKERSRLGWVKHLTSPP